MIGIFSVYYIEGSKDATWVLILTYITKQNNSFYSEQILEVWENFPSPAGFNPSLEKC